MFRRVPLLLLLIVMSGCGSRSGDVRWTGLGSPVQWVVNRLTGTDCRARQIPPGSTYFDYDNGGGWVQMGDDGKVHPISAPLRSVSSAQRDKGDSPSGP